MSTRTRNGNRLIPWLLGLLPALGCAQPTLVAPPGDLHHRVVDENRRVLVTRPHFRAAEVRGLTETEHEIEVDDSTQIADALVAELNDRGLQAFTASGAGVQAAVDGLESHIEVLQSFFKDKGPARGALARLRSASDAELVCLLTGTMRKGIRGGYDPNSGRIWQGTDTGELRVTLLSLASGEMVWANECFIRKIPKTSDVLEIVRLMMTQLQTTKNGEQQ